MSGDRPPLPVNIGRYQVEGLIGRGAMGAVYRAHDPDIDRKVAIKLVHASLLEDADGDEFRTRFRREAQAAARCVHPNIVAVYDLAIHEGSPFIAMEFVEGTSLAHMVASRRASGAAFTAAEAGGIVLQILDALAGAHAFGIVHRDIKPANILVTGAGTVKITDFGVARLALSDLTQGGAMVGTLSYMSPEQCRGEEVDGRADLFSVACMLHELVTGARPFPGRNQAEVMRRLLQEPPAGLADAPISDALRQVIVTGLEKLAPQRFASAAVMAGALRAALGAPSPVPDGTVVLPRPEASAPSFDPALLADMERHLTRYLGPIARAIVQSAARRAPSLEALRDILARGIEQPVDRARFLREATDVGLTGVVTGVPGPRTSTGITAEAAGQAQRELARTLGPIAAVLVKRTLPKAVDTADLWTQLATHIESQPEREAFLRKMPR